VSTQIEPIVTIAELDAMPDDGNRYEIIEGELFLSKAPGIPHQRVFGEVFDSFRSYLREQPIGEVIATPGLILSETDAVIPDLAFVLNERASEVVTGDRLTAAPDLVVEILSPGLDNLRRDRVAKRQMYARFGVKEYWILDPQKRIVEIYVLKGRVLELVASLGKDDELTSPMLPGFSCRIESIFKHV
jgi:Uma2 family endonuclease